MPSPLAVQLFKAKDAFGSSGWRRLCSAVVKKELRLGFWLPTFQCQHKSLFVSLSYLLNILGPKFLYL